MQRTCRSEDSPGGIGKHRFLGMPRRSNLKIHGTRRPSGYPGFDQRVNLRSVHFKPDGERCASPCRAVCGYAACGQLGAPLPTHYLLSLLSVSEGRRLCHSVACSYACASARTRASAQCGPLICNPIGKPAFVNPQGTEMVGRPKILN